MKDPQPPDIEERFRKEFDELKLKPPQNSMPNLERELIIDFWRKAIKSEIEKHYISKQAVLEALETLTTRHCDRWKEDEDMCIKSGCKDNRETATQIKSSLRLEVKDNE